MSQKTQGIALMAVCAVLWSTAGILFKYIPWHPLVIAGLRAVMAGVTAGLYLLWQRLPLIVNKKTLSTGGAMCCTCTLFVMGNKLTTAANAIVLQYTAPAFLVLYTALLLHRRVRRADLLAVLCTLGGIALFFFDQMDAGHLLGNLLSVAAGASMGLMFLLMGEAKPEERFSSILVCQILTALISLPFLFTTRPVLSFIPVLFIVLLGVFQLGVPYVLYALASAKCPPLACSLITALEPLLNPVWVLLFYGERPGPFALVGGAVVIVSITLWCIFGDRQKAASTEGESHDEAGRTAG